MRVVTTTPSRRTVLRATAWTAPVVAVVAAAPASAASTPAAALYTITITSIWGAGTSSMRTAAVSGQLTPVTTPAATVADVPVAFTRASDGGLMTSLTTNSDGSFFDLVSSAPVGASIIAMTPDGSTLVFSMP